LESSTGQLLCLNMAGVFRQRLRPFLFVETYNNGSHDITLLESFLGTRGRRIVTGDAGITFEVTSDNAMETCP